MKKHPRLFFWIIIILGLFCILVDFPSIKKPNFNPSSWFNIVGLPKPSFREGLDIKGGTSITFQANMSGIPQSEQASALNSVQTVIQRRVDFFGVSNSVVQTATVNNSYRIIVELPGVTDLATARRVIGTTAKLTFWQEAATTSAKIASSSAYPSGLLTVLSNPVETSLTGADISQASVAFSSNTGSPEVQLVFTNQGTSKFANITKRNVGKILAIVLDNQLLEAPVVNQAILTGNGVITGNFTLNQATNLATELNAGALPVPLTVLQQQVVGPTLGQISLEKSLIAGVFGFVIIVVFMSLLYGFLGVLASLALFIYTLLVLAIFKLSSLTPFAITLTISGVAGFVLSVGMAVDANILIFERMKEELRNGRTRQQAVDIGFSRAWTSIRDSNTSTLITSVVLYEFGIGVVRGFALVLAIGVLVSMFSAIVVTRTFLKVGFKQQIKSQSKAVLV